MTHRDRESEVVERVAEAISSVPAVKTLEPFEFDYQALARAAIRETLAAMIAWDGMQEYHFRRFAAAHNITLEKDSDG